MAFHGPTRRAFVQGDASHRGARSHRNSSLRRWKKYAGTTIEANLIKGPRGDLLQKYAAEFTELTGIKVESEVTPEQQQRQKAVIELISANPASTSSTSATTSRSGSSKSRLAHWPQRLPEDSQPNRAGLAGG
jgi:hypothetical protein